MIPTTGQVQDNKIQAARVGIYAAGLLAVLNVWYLAAFAGYQPALRASWPGMAAYAAGFKALPLMVWVVPCFLIGPAVLMMMACVHTWAGNRNRLWSLLAVLFAVPAAALLCLNYYIQMTVVRHNLTAGVTEGLRLWLYADPYPFTIPGAIEGVGYGFICVSFLCAAQVFQASRLERWIRWAFVGNGLTGLVVFADPLWRIPMPALIVDGILCGVFLTLAPVLLGVAFWKSIRAIKR